MAVFKCKMCGGTIEFAAGDTVGVCDSCGTKQTLPRLDDDKKANLYDRANHFRRNNDFDKAMGIYEQILNEDPDDAEAYWSLVLCRYGIEYVEDPQTRKRIPTVNRAQFTSIFADEDYKSSLAHADAYQKAIYEEEAHAIDDIQKGILEISSKEKPFDVFICYKETDANGKRTQDSVLANDLYHQLTQEGFKVFFARITLEDKLGVAYEPYIFAALNSAKVMVVLGTKPEYFNAVWVKNEWSRYLALVKNAGGKKMLIPAYKDMDPYDLPDEFSHLQAQDMSKLGFMQDLIRGIKKIVGANDSTQVGSAAGAGAAAVSGAAGDGTSAVTPLLKRAFMFLEDKNWESANEYCERVLDIDPEYAEAYLGKLMVDLKISSRAGLKDAEYPFDDWDDCVKAARFGNDALRHELAEANECIRQRIEYERLDGLYAEALKAVQAASSERGFLAAASKFDDLGDYKDAGENAAFCRVKAAQQHEKEAKERAEREQRAKTKAKRVKKIALVATTIVCVAIIAAVLVNVVIPSARYNDAVSLMESGNTVEAYEAFSVLGDYKDAAQQVDLLRDSYIEAKVGFWSLSFGSYEQDGDTSNGKESIEWQILDVKDGKALIISKDALDAKSYNSRYEDTTWEQCSLRAWLNNEFLNSAFTAEEQERIVTSTVTADKNLEYNTNPGNDTSDKIFLLSIDEANKYFASNTDRQCKSTAYAVKQGAFTNGDGLCWWRLRSPGRKQDRAARVDTDGDVRANGNSVVYVSRVARPALWINLES